MAGRYVPPALRKKQNQAQAASTEAEKAGEDVQPTETVPQRQQNSQVSLEDIHAHFWPPAAADTEQPARSTPRPGNAKGTLNTSAADPEKLAYVILFHNANPRWATHGIIFTKSNLELLPPATAEDQPDVSAAKEEGKEVNGSAGDHEVPDSTASQSLESSDETISSVGKQPVPKATPNTTPIAVFTQDRGPQSNRSYAFTGWYEVSRLTFLEPKSADLARMLEQKWARTNQRTGEVKHQARDAEKWRESLGYRWAVLKLEKSKEAKEDLVVARIDQGGAEKSVNEMLAEMRMGSKSE